MDDALDRGQHTQPEVVYQLPVASVAFVERVAELLAEVVAYFRSDDSLLTLIPPADVAAYRHWSIQEVVRQHAGHDPIPWPAYAAERGLS